MSNISAADQALIHRLNRAQGQIEAIKKNLAAGGDKDCLKTIQLAKAATNAIKKFAEAYVSEHLNECVRNNLSHDEIERNLKDVVSSAFSL